MSGTFSDPHDPAILTTHLPIAGLGGTAIATAVAPDTIALPLTPRRVLLYSSGSLGAGLFFALHNVLLPIYLRGLGAPYVLIGLLSSQRSVEGAVIQPLVGAWSDRLWTPLGRRRPFIAICVPLCAAFLTLTALLPGSPVLGRALRFLGAGHDTAVLAIIALGIFLFSLAFNIMIDPYTALLADITPPRQRGGVNGIAQTCAAVGQAAVLLATGAVYFLGGSLDRALIPLFLVTAVGLVLCFAPTVLGVREPRALAQDTGPRRYGMRASWAGLRGDRRLQLYFACELFLWLAISAAAPFLGLYAMHVIGPDGGLPAVLGIIGLGALTLLIWPIGVLADRIGLKPILLIGILLLAAASVLAIWARQPLFLLLAVAAGGLGNAAATASSYPLLTRLVPADRMGLYTGLNGTITSIATPAAAVLSGLLLDRLGPGGMLPYVAALFVLAAIPLALLREPNGRGARHPSTA